MDFDPVNKIIVAFCLCVPVSIIIMLLDQESMGIFWGSKIFGYIQCQQIELVPSSSQC